MENEMGWTGCTKSTNPLLLLFKQLWHLDSYIEELAFVFSFKGDEKRGN